uniref:Putative salivary lipocalin n=1 Tax=Rhipicephalus pulchellus TaxID=72859 RepID=L7LR85_RHIPC
MRLHPLFINCLFLSIVKSGKYSIRTVENSVVRDGWKFLARDKYFLMIKRTYNVSGALNNSMCVMIPFSPSIDKKKRALNTTFTYRNLSSTHKMYPQRIKDNASYWPIARFEMKFYLRKLKRKTIFGRTRFDFVNSTTLTSDYGYTLSPPFWRFMYCNSRCAIVEVLDLTRGTPEKKRSPRKRLCELWISVGVGKTLASHETYTKSKERICEAFFNRWCDTGNVQIVYDVDMCNREFLIPDS